jgi:putative zinc finger protein
MTHQELEHLASDYLEGSLDAVRRAEAQAHLDRCASCREMIAGLERVLDLCRAAEDLETPPWMVNRILLATVGERKPTLGERLSSLLRPTLQPRLVYGLAMAVFSMTFILHAAGLKVGQVTLDDLNPATWFRLADRTGHRLIDRAEKFAYDLRVVYEIESRLKQLRGQSNQPATEPGGERQTPKSQPPSGGTTESKPVGPPVLAGGSTETFSNHTDLSRQVQNVSLIHVPDLLVEPGRSSTR